MDVYCEEVIINKSSTRGEGTQNSPIRQVTLIYQKDGKLIGEMDEMSWELFINAAVAFAKYCQDNSFTSLEIGKDQFLEFLEQHKKK